MRTRVGLLLSMVLVLTATSQAADYTIAPLDEKPPEELAADITAALESQGYKVRRGANRTVCDLWLAKEWSAKPDFKPSLSVLYPFEVGQLVGAVRFRRKAEDFRGQEIPAGVYTLRYALQPVDGNHVGTSDTRDFLVLLRAEDDKNPGPVPEAQLHPLSAKAAGTTHPAMWMLMRVRGDEQTPQMRHYEDRDLHTVVLSGKAKAGDKVSDQRLEVVVVGKTEG